jgi:hypothetical protein
MGTTSPGKQITYCFLDEDPVACAAGLAERLRQRWASGAVKGLLAAPFYTVVPFDWGAIFPAGEAQASAISAPVLRHSAARSLSLR